MADIQRQVDKILAEQGGRPPQRRILRRVQRVEPTPLDDEGLPPTLPIEPDDSDGDGDSFGDYDAIPEYCGVCTYFQPEAPGEDGMLYGQCHAYAPTDRGWPVIHISEYCGDFRADIRKFIKLHLADEENHP